jgi:uncharacterized protein YfaS (alpha-2-macroglobulin family)
MRFSATLLALCFTAAPLAAQDDTLRVLRHTPSDTASPGNIITVTFDRPVAGLLDASVDASRIFRIEPATPGVVAWRDPITIRFVPAKPLTPGRELTVTIDTAFHALDGSRLAHPYRFTFRVPGPRLLARSIGTGYPNAKVGLPLDGKIQLLYSAAVDLDLLRRAARIELENCNGSNRRVALRPVRQRAVAKNDPYQFSYAGVWRDTVANSFRRVVELEPESPLPPDCDGQLVIPNTAADAMHGSEERFAVATMPTFRLMPFDCTNPRQCKLAGLVVSFTASVKREDILKHVRVLPAIELNLPAYRQVSAQWEFVQRLAPRTRYTVVVDSGLRDVDGRRLEGAHSVSLVTGDYEPAVAFPQGYLTLSRSVRALPVRHVNVAAIRVIAYRIRDADRFRALNTPPWSLHGELEKLADNPEQVVVELDTPFNVEKTTDIPLPPSVADAGGALFAVRIESARDMPSPAADTARSAPGTQPSIRVAPIVVPAYIPQYLLMQRTDLAVHAKPGAEESTVLVTGASDGRPRGGATVRQVDPSGNVIAQGTTGTDGLARLQLPHSESAATEWRDGIVQGHAPREGFVEATLGSDRVSLALRQRNFSYEYYDDPFNVASLGGTPGLVPFATATIYADRGIYRPGETLHLGGVLREGMLGALSLPARDEKVRLTVTHREYPWPGNDDVTIRDTVLTLSAFGTITDSLRLTPAIALGSYVAELHVGGPGHWNSVASENVRVAEYRAPEFLVETTADSAPRYGGDTVHVRAVGRYLFGAPMGEAQVRWSALLREMRPWELHIPGAEGWTVGEWDWWTRRDDAATPPRTISGEGVFDASGRVKILVPIDSLRPSRAGRVAVDVAVIDVNRQTVTSSVEVPVHPARLYILTRLPARQWYLTAGQRAHVDVQTVRPDGTRVPNVPVIVTLVRRDWTWQGGTGSWVTHAIRTDTVVTRSSVASYTFVPATSGLYELRLVASDGRGGTARTTMGSYALSGGSRWGAGNSYRLPLIADTRELAVGDTAKVVFDSPFADADAWVTIEREGILEQRRMTVRRGTNVIPVRITGRHVPNVWVSVLLLRHSAPGVQADSSPDLIRAGYTELRVGTSTKQLKLALAPRAAVYRPGDTAFVRVKVSDAAGRAVASEVTLWAVDQGVLALDAYETPDLIARMYRPRGLGNGLFSTLPSLIGTDTRQLQQYMRRQDAFSASTRIRGATSLSEVVVADVEQASLRSEFRSTAFYIASARTDATGEAVMRAKLPDNLTTYRVMAVAVGADDRFGSGDTTLLVTRELVARPTLPRFVRAGDTLLAGATINVRDGRSRPVTVQATSEGIAIQGTPRQTITLAGGKGAEARFVFRVPSRDSVRDTVVVRLRASDGTSGDAVETRLPVRADYHPRLRTLIGTASAESDVVFDLPADIDAARSRLTLRLGTSPVAPMLAAYEWLRVYPYDCTEQLASGGRALIAVWRVTREKMPNAVKGDPPAQLRELVTELVRRQRPDGAIRYWHDDDWTTPWLSAYAGLFLLEARDAGIPVDSVTIARLTAYLSDTTRAVADTGATNRFERRRKRLALGDGVAIVDYLRRAGVPNVKAEDALLGVTGVMTWEDRLRLAEVLASRGDVRARTRALVDSAWRAVTVAGKRVDLPDSAHAEREFPSHIAPAARLLSASLVLRADHPLIGGLIETVLQQERAERTRSWSTQDYASVVQALAPIVGQQSAASNPVRLLAGGRTLLARAITPADSSESVPLAGLLDSVHNGRRQLRLHLSGANGSAPTYYALSVEEIPSKAPVTPDFKGIVVERWYERLDDGRPVTAVREGDLVRVRLRVTVPADRQFVAVEDPLPAGLEVVDLSLRTSGTLKPFMTPESEEAGRRGDRDRDGPLGQAWGYGSWDNGWWSPWEHKELHDDRIVYFARALWKGSYTASYVARATTAGDFTRPPAHAEEMYNPALQGRSDGGRFGVMSGGP